MPTPGGFAARAETYRDVVRGVARLRCEACPRERRCDSWDQKPVPIYVFRDFAACPASYLRAPWWREVLAYDDALFVAPLSGWPDDIPAYVVSDLAALKRARAHRADGG
ncbi:MAG: hypothetical protein AMXMBFR77_27980 [Phycisphaerales bacterium]